MVIWFERDKFVKQNAILVEETSKVVKVQVKQLGEICKLVGKNRKNVW